MRRTKHDAGHDLDGATVRVAATWQHTESWLSGGIGTVKDACVQSGMGRTFILREIASGRLAARKAGRRTLIHRNDFEAWWYSLPLIAQHSSVEQVTKADEACHD